MGFGEAINICFAKYATFSGRATRPEYWYWVLFTVVAGLVLGIIQFAVWNLGGQILELLFHVAILIPSIAVAVRRLHDLDRSGWWLLLAFVPLVGVIILIVWMCTRGTPGANRFG
jgi:uncharacterized membrane protein YhaH (DUF805 family)